MDTDDEAEAYVEADPFAKAGPSRGVQIEPWSAAFLARERSIDLG